MTRVKEISKCIEELAPLSLQENYDNAGLVIGDPEMKVSGIIFCLDSTEKVVDEAIEKKCNLIIAHHPIIFRGLKKIQNSHYVDKTVQKAIKNDISIYAAHTNLDNVKEGVNGKIADKLELKHPEILKPIGNEAEKGAGLIGELSSSKSEEDFLEYLKIKMDLKVIRHSPLIGKNIRKVAICGGAGSFLISEARAANVDAYITGDIKYHEFFEANDEMLLLDIGHYESERFTIEIFHQVLSRKFPNIALQFSRVNTNPINYSI